MSTRILRQRDTNTSYRLVPLEEDGEANASELPLSTISKDQGKSKKRRITKNRSPTLADPQIQFPTPQIFQDHPTFHLIIARHHPHAAYNALPSKIRYQHTVELFEILSLFLTLSLLEDMAAHSNAYAAAKATERQMESGRKWKEVSASELGLWLGIVLYMGVHSSPAVRDYGRHNGLNPTHPICEYMGQTRFEEIKRYFHVSSPDLPKIAPTGRRLCHSKVDLILDQLRKSSHQYRMPSTHVSLDECMIRATGRSPDTYKMPSKPIEQGFTFHCLADHGYTWDFHPTSNHAGPDPVPSTDGLTATGEVVYHLLRKLPSTMYFIVYLDNYYTTVPLLGRLRHDLHMGACGTARPSSAGFPPQLKIPKQDIGKYEYHALKVLTVKDSLFGQLVGAHLWFDNVPVTILSTVHDFESQQERLTKRPGKKSTNAKKAREAFGDLQEKQMMIALCIDDYNHNMGGVDIADQLHSYYDTQLTSIRTWWPMLFWAFDTMVTNAYFIYQDMPQSSKTITHKEFRLQCAWGLILAGSGPISTSQIVQSTKAKSTRSNVHEDTYFTLD